jgi:methyltransferase
VNSQLLFTAFVLAVGVERLAELTLSKRHAAWAFSRGGKEFGRGHFPPMVALHTALLVGALAEVWMLERPFLPILGWTALAIVIASQSLRWWCIASLGRQWNTRVIVVPGLPLVSRGPYRLLRHPNYVAVVLEGAALPLVHSAWLTAVGFTVLNAALLARRIQVEEEALATVAGKAASLR